MLRVSAALGWRFLVVVAALYVVGTAAGYLAALVVPVAIALLLAALLAPAVQSLRQRRVPHGVATALVMVGGLALVGGVLAFVVITFVRGVPDLGTQLSASVDAVVDWLTNGPLRLSEQQLRGFQDQLLSTLSDNQASITAGALTTAATVGEIVTESLLVVFTLIFFLQGGAAIWQFLLGVVPERRRMRADVAGRRALAALVSYVRATAAVAVVDAVAIGIGLAVLEVPLAVPLAALVFLGAFVPIVGAVRGRRGGRADRAGRPGSDHRVDRARHHHRDHAAGEPRPAAAAVGPGGQAAPAGRGAGHRRPACWSPGSPVRCSRCRCWPCSTPASGRCSARPTTSSTPETCTPANPRTPGRTTRTSTASPT